MAFNISNVEKRRSPGISIIVTAVLLLVIGTFFFVVWPNISRKTTNLTLGDGVFKTELAVTDSARQKGLSGRKSIAENEAFLMVFPNDYHWEIWMKDMKFPIDIVWLNSEKEVVDFIQNVSPDESTKIIHKPKVPARYVVEFKAGTVNNKAIHIKGKAIFQINSEIK